MKLGLKINKRTLLYATGAILAVRYAPLLLAKVMPDTINSAITNKLLAGGVGVGVGIALKNEVMQTVAAAATISSIAGDTIDEMITKGGGTPPGKAIPANAGANSRRLSNYTTLNDFPRNVGINNNYRNAYN